MKKSLFVAGGIALVASGLVYYFFSRTKKEPVTDQTKEVSGHAKGEKMLRHAMHRAKEAVI